MSPRAGRARQLALGAMADDAARQQSCNLLERNLEASVRTLAAQRDDVLLVALGEAGFMALRYWPF